jgi:hypothetical protein
MLPTSVITSRAEASIASGSAGSFVSSSFRIAAPDSSRISSASPATGLVHAGDVTLDDAFERRADVGHGVQGDLRHVEQHPMSRQLRE